MGIAIVFDIHGTLTALDAVISDLEHIGPALVVQGGDLALMGPRPAEVVDRIRELGWPGITWNTISNENSLSWRHRDTPLPKRTSRLPLRITTLGGFGVACGDTTIDDRAWGRPKARTLVKYLLCQPGLAAPREVLYEALWPERPPGKASSNLWYTLSLVRHALGANSSRSKETQYVRVEGELCRLTLDASDWWDAAAFRAAYDRARADGAPAGETAAAAWLAAEVAYGGPFLPGDLYEDWAAAPREELQERYLDVLWRLARYFGQQGEQEKALGRYLQMLAIDPLQEHVHRALMETFAAGGRRDRALRQYLLCRQMLESRLGVEPDAATVALYRQILG